MVNVVWVNWLDGRRARSGRALRVASSHCVPPRSCCSTANASLRIGDSHAHRRSGTAAVAGFNELSFEGSKSWALLTDRGPFAQFPLTGSRQVRSLEGHYGVSIGPASPGPSNERPVKPLLLLRVATRREGLKAPGHPVDTHAPTRVVCKSLSNRRLTIVNSPHQ